MDEPVVAPATPQITYKDDDLVYVDPDARVVVGFVEWTTTGKAKTKAIPNAAPVEAETDDKKGKRRITRQRYYPWGTYRSMKKMYKLEGKVHKEESTKTLDEVIERALQEPFWD